MPKLKKLSLSRSVYCDDAEVVLLRQPGNDAVLKKLKARGVKVTLT